jgi:hypothetical protein
MRIGMGVGITDSANKIGEGRAVPWADNAFAATINDVGNGGSVFGVYFDGPPLADVLGSNPSEFSVSFWIKRGTHGWGSTDPKIIGSTTDFDNPNKGFGIYQPDNPRKYFWVGSLSNKERTHEDYLQNDWHHFVFTFNSGTPKYYRDGVIWGESGSDTNTDWNTGGTGTFPTTVDTSGTQNLRIGIYGNTNIPTTAENPGFFDGYLDEVAIYTKELSQSDVDYVSATTIPDLLGEGAPTGLAGWWRFGDADGDDDTLGTGVLKDASGNGHDMDIVDASGGSGFLEFQDSDTPET